MNALTLLRLSALGLSLSLGLGLGLGLTQASAQEEAATLRVDFSNPGLTPSTWTLELHPDGRAHFRSDPGTKTAAELHEIEPGPIDRDIQLSHDFAARAFAIAHRNKLFDEKCDSHLKVAFQGWKTFTYTGPDGTGTCEFNYSRNNDLQSLSDAFVAVTSTIVEGARLELLLQHDPLGLDKEMEFLEEASADGRVQEMCAIHPILARLADDADVMERVRRRARMLLQDSK
jgi:hypothetical protein